MSTSGLELEKTLHQVLLQLLNEIRPNYNAAQINIDSKFDKDLGLDSLTRVEFFHRVEKALHIEITPAVMTSANSLREVIHALSHQEPSLAKHKTAIQSSSPLQASAVEASAATTLVEVLLAHAQQEPNRPHILLQSDEGTEVSITYGQLWEQSLAVAAGLSELGIKPLQTIAIMLPTCAEFFPIFFGTLLLGAIPVPIYPPTRITQIEEYTLREAKILENAEARVLVTFGKAKRLSQLLRALLPSLTTVMTAKQLLSSNVKDFQFNPNAAKPNSPALIQYTSGSTGIPKGVVLTHANLLANIRSYGNAIKVNSTDVVVSWLPLYHDMGLIGSWLGSFYHAVPATIMSPLAFLSRPERWLWTVHYRRATISGGPNFAFELCVNKIEPEDIVGLDLSSWRLAFNGAEAIIPRTLERFAEKFAPYGFKEEALCPVYGLAEATVGLAVSELTHKPQVDFIARDSFEKNNAAIPINANDKNALQFVNCGITLPGHTIRIVDEQDQTLTERHVGNIEFRGPSAMQGYYRNKEATEAVMHDDWVRTGDRGYLAENSLYITGRKKDLIIKGGRNFHPEGIERAATTVDGVRQGCVVAFAVTDQQMATEKLVVVAETYAETTEEKQQLRHAINEKISTVTGIEPDVIELAAPRTIPKTSSGKLQRAECKKLYMQGQLQAKSLPLSVQLTKLLSRGIWQSARRKASKVGRLFYSAYVFIIAGIFFPFIWCSIMLTPRSSGRTLTKFWANFLLRTIFCRLSVTQLSNSAFTSKQPVIFTPNHASYLDAVVLIAALPKDVVIISKGELQHTPIINKFLVKLGHFAVERSEMSQSLQDVESMKHILDNHSIAIFPEGTFEYRAGLRPFKMGAFKLAAETNRSLCPVVIVGTRKFMRSDKFLLRPINIRVVIAELISPQGNDWNEAVRLSNLVRDEILRHNNEQAIYW